MQCQNLELWVLNAKWCYIPWQDQASVCTCTHPLAGLDAYNLIVLKVSLNHTKLTENLFLREEGKEFSCSLVLQHNFNISHTLRALIRVLVLLFVWFDFLQTSAFIWIPFLFLSWKIKPICISLEKPSCFFKNFYKIY